jgi:predicted nucleic acid-binding protein
MMYLLDTNVVSGLRKASRKRAGAAAMDAHCRKWFAAADSQQLYLSVVTVLELEIGCLLLERRDAAQGAVIRTWIRERCAALHVPDPLEDRDSLIAATAMVHGMTVVTRNVDHFERTGVPILNPWTA